MIHTRWLKSLVTNTKGNTAVMFAVAALPLTLMAGGAVDMMQTYSVKSKLQKAVDAAALQAAAARKLDDAGRKRAALASFADNFAGDGTARIKTVQNIRITKDKVIFTARASVPTHFLKLASIGSIDIMAKAVIKRHYGSMEVALVLDNTRSMAGTKIATLKRAAKKLTGTLFKEGAKDKIHVSVVPYAQYVNVGKDKRGASWLNAPADKTIYHPARCYMSWTYKAVNCHMSTCTSWNDGVSTTHACRKCDWVRDKQVRTCTPAWTQKVTWNGCVGSRRHPLNVTDSAPGKRIPGISGVWCQRPILPLNTDKGAIDRELDRMSANVNGTYIPSGLIWGWRALSSAAPYTQGTDANTARKKNVRKAIVLMTDGVNTCDPDYTSGRHYCGQGKGKTANALTRELCGNIKKAGIHIYSVAFGVTDPATRKMLQSCASDGASYFDARDNSALLAAFKDIGKSLATIYLSE